MKPDMLTKKAGMKTMIHLEVHYNKKKSTKKSRYVVSGIGLSQPGSRDNMFAMFAIMGYNLKKWKKHIKVAKLLSLRPQALKS